MNKTTLTALFLTFFALTAMSLTAQGTQDTSAPAATAAAAAPVSKGDTDGDSLPDNTEQLIGTNPYQADTDGDGTPDSSDNDPLNSSRSISESSSAALPVKVLDARVEDNYKADDHLEIALKNTGSADIALQDGTITISDKVSSGKEVYYVDLGGFVLKAGSKTVLHFDNGTAPGHFPGNVNGLYRTATEGLTFDIVLHSRGFQPLALQTEKAPGAAEIAD